jgi:hypothetical protein
MFNGEEVGELYNLKDDPWETNNLYSNIDYKNIRDQMMRILIDWLVCSSRHRTSHPPVSRDEGGREVFKLAGDGKESNTAGPRLRIREGKVNYL